MRGDNSNSNYLLGQRLGEKSIIFLDTIAQKVKEFVRKCNGKPIAMVTSGGTSVPLQKNTVRILQNMSTGLRGSQLAEQLLKKDVNVIFYFREGSFLPYSKGLKLNQVISYNKIKQIQQSRNELLKQRQNILLLSFQTIYQYLNGILLIKKELPPTSVLILCAAVSDFIPKKQAEHKIHTSAQLVLQFESSPKILKEMTGKHHLCASFKLETDIEKLVERVQFAMEKYDVDVIVGNILGIRTEVTINFNPKTVSLENKKIIERVEQNIVQIILLARKNKFNLI